MRFAEQVRASRTLAALLWLVACALGAPSAAAPQWQNFVYGGDAYAAASAGQEAWIGTGAGLRIFTAGQPAASVRELTIANDLPGAVITALTFVPGGLWAGAAGGAVGRFDFETATWSHHGREARFPAADPTDLVFDGTDLWAATAGGGVARFDEQRAEWSAYDRADGLPSDLVLSLAADADSVWAGTDRGAARLDRQTQTWTPLTSDLPGAAALSDAIVDLALSRAYLWLATYQHGLARIDRQTGALEPIEGLRAQYGVERVDRLYLGPDGTLWIAADKALLRAEAEGAGAWTVYPHAPWLVTGLTQAGGSLWVATARGGIHELRLADNAWQAYGAQEALPGGDVSSMVATDTEAFAGFRDAGLARYDGATQRWTPVGNAPRQIADLALSDGLLYVASSQGLAQYDPRADSWLSLHATDFPELGSDAWSSVVASAAGVWFAGLGRLAHLGPGLAPRWVMDLTALTGLDLRAWPRLVEDGSNGDVWVITATGAVRHSRADNQIQTLGGDWLLPADPAAAEGEGRLLRDLATDAENVWLVGLDALCQYRKLDGSVTRWNAAYLPALAAPRLVAPTGPAVWVATDSALARLDRRDLSWVALPWPDELADSPPTALAPDPYEPQLIWVANATHTARLELAEDGPQWRVYPRRTGLPIGVSRFVPRRSGVWVAGRNGLSYYQRDLATP